MRREGPNEFGRMAGFEGFERIALCRDRVSDVRGQDPRTSSGDLQGSPGGKGNRGPVLAGWSANWRDAVDKAEKREFVTQLNTVFNEAGSVVVAHYTGLTVAQMGEFRTKMREAGGSVKVAKNRLAKIALKGTEAEGVSDLFSGQTVIAYANDPVTAPKVASEFAKSNDKLVLLGGALGATVLDEKGVKALAELPSLDELRAKLVGMISTPATRIAQVVNAPAGNLARVFNAYAQKDEAA
jgi:large subunit ribosomal protein L10